jgi:hypothetical protein
VNRTARRTCTSLIATLALVAAGCGGGGSSSSTKTAASTTTTTAGAGAADAAERCLTKAGFDVRSSQPTTKAMVASLYINEDKLNQVFLAFLKTGEAAGKFKKGTLPLTKLAGGKASAELVGKDIVLVRAKRSTNGEVSRVKGCLTS